MSLVETCTCRSAGLARPFWSARRLLWQMCSRAWHCSSTRASTLLGLESARSTAAMSGKTTAPKRMRDEFEHDSGLRGCDIRL